MPKLERPADLLPCPFCGEHLHQKWNRVNPSAACKTENCMGGKLPAICLDVPEHVEAWNRRVVKVTDEITNSPTPVCPHCQYVYSFDDMAENQAIDFFGMAPNEEISTVICPVCDKEFWLKGGYTPHFASAFAEELF